MAPSILATFLRARRQSTMVMALFLFLPCLSFFLLFFTLAFFLFLPIMCILISISLSLSILRRISILYFPQISRNQLEKPLPMMDDEDDDPPAVQNSRVSVEYDQSEVPSFTESELGSEIGEDFSNDKEEIISNFWKFRNLKPPRDDRSFDEVLSFWKMKERAREGGPALSLSRRLASW